MYQKLDQEGAVLAQGHRVVNKAYTLDGPPKEGQELPDGWTWVEDVPQETQKAVRTDTVASVRRCPMCGQPLPSTEQLPLAKAPKVDTGTRAATMNTSLK